MRPMLDDIALPQVQSVISHDVRTLAEHVPVAGESQLQSLGRAATRIVVTGVATEDAVAPLARRLDEAVRSGTPVSFTSDVTAASALQRVTVEDADFIEVAGRPGELGYVIVLCEHLKAVSPDATPGLDTDVLAEAESAIGDLAAGLSIAGDLSTGLDRFLPALGDLLARLKDFQERLEATRS